MSSDWGVRLKEYLDYARGVVYTLAGIVATIGLAFLLTWLVNFIVG